MLEGGPVFEMLSSFRWPQSVSWSLCVVRLVITQRFRFLVFTNATNTDKICLLSSDDYPSRVVVFLVSTLEEDNIFPLARQSKTIETIFGIIKW